jgi:uncharacterized membrane protein YkvA (DUF1232 family)
MQAIQSAKDLARRMQRTSVALWFAYRHPETPLLAKLVCMLIVAYALSPIDLIPDFIPVLGFLDELLLLPGLIWLAQRLVPRDVMAASEQAADIWMNEHRTKPTIYAGAALILVIWILLAAGIWYWLEVGSG